MPIIFKENNNIYSSEYDDIYFSQEGGVDEKYHVFIKGNSLPERFKKVDDFTILELGFGAGLNFVLTSRLFNDSGAGKLNYISIEKHPLSKDEIDRALSLWPELEKQKQMLLDVYENKTKSLNAQIRNVMLNIIFADVDEALLNLDMKADAVFLDGFSPDKNKRMWSDELFKKIYKLVKPRGTFATYSCAGRIRRSLEAAGFEVERVKGFGKKRNMLRGIKK